jgi:hypothetical protein
MKNLTYQNYLDDPAVRAELEVQVRRARNEAIDQYLIAPIITMAGKMINTLRGRPTAVPALLTRISAS